MAANGSSGVPTEPFNNNSGLDLQKETFKQDTMDTSTEEVLGAVGGNAGPHSSVKPGASVVSNQNRVPGIVSSNKPGAAGTKDTMATASTTGSNGSEGIPGDSSKKRGASSGSRQKNPATDKILFSSGAVRTLDPHYDSVTGIKVLESWANEVDQAHPLEETCEAASSSGDSNA